MFVYRKYIIEELLESENIYVRNLQLIVEIMNEIK